MGDYFTYLVKIVDGDRNLQLCKELFDIPFHWDPEIDLDENGAENGKYLRVEYYQETGKKCEKSGGCSVLEMIIGIVVGMERIMGIPGDEHPERWFWEIIENLDLESGDVKKKVERWMNREFDKDGNGGMFPISRPFQDQRTAPFWQQAMSYLGERV